MTDLFDLKGRVALVTGAGRGIGHEIAILLAEHGARLAINDFDRDRAAETVKAIKATGREAIALACDVSDYQAASSMAREAAEQFGRIDVLINNAGNAGAHMALGDWKPFWETDPAEWRNWLGVNLDGVLNTCRAVLPGMIERRFGRLVLIASDAGRVGEPHFAVYSAAKAGAMGLMRALAKAGGRYGITANSISLGGVDTPGAKSILTDDEATKRMLSHYVIRRVGKPLDAAAMVLLLASDAGEWITGQTYPVNGGYSFAL